MTIWGSTAGPRPGRVIAAGTALLAGGVLLAACSSGSASQQTAAQATGSSAAPLAGQTITLYNGQHQQTTNALVKAFEKQTGVTVKVRSDDEDVLAQQITQEGTHSPADVFYTENTPPLVRLDEKGLLAKVAPGALIDVPSQYSATDHDWVGVSARLSTLVYNTRDLKPSQLPTSVLGLADPKWKGKLDIAPSETDFQPIVTSVDAHIGDAATVTWLKALKANAGVHSDPDNETLVANVNKGVTELGVINHYYWYRLKDEVGPAGLHSALARFAPHDDGYLLDVSGAAVLKSSQHQQAAQALVKFLVSRSGQLVLAKSDSWEYPIGDGITNPALPPLDRAQPKNFSLTRIGDGSKAISLLQQAGLL
jgi:iron(III) transport system substrate-binding protein